MAGSDSPRLISVAQLATMAEMWDLFTNCGVADSAEARDAERAYWDLVEGHYSRCRANLTGMTGINVTNFEAIISVKCRQYIGNNEIGKVVKKPRKS